MRKHSKENECSVHAGKSFFFTKFHNDPGNVLFFLNELYELTVHTVLEQMTMQKLLRREQEGGGIQERLA